MYININNFSTCMVESSDPLCSEQGDYLKDLSCIQTDIHNNYNNIIIAHKIFRDTKFVNASNKTLQKQLKTKKKHLANHLQGHCNWLVEMTIKVVSAITKETKNTVGGTITAHVVLPRKVNFFLQDKANL